MMMRPIPSSLSYVSTRLGLVIGHTRTLTKLVGIILYQSLMKGLVEHTIEFNLKIIGMSLTKTGLVIIID